MSETLKAHKRRISDGFYDKFCNGKLILDIGYAGTGGETMPNMNVTGIDINTPGYDGLHLPFPDNHWDIIYSSHLLEHVKNDVEHIKEQFRCTKLSGFVIIYVPHQWLYEKKASLPSRFNLEHHRFYTPASLLKVVEEALPVNHYRIRLLKDCDEGFDYSIPEDQHSVGEYAIECVIQKIK